MPHKKKEKQLSLFERNKQKLLKFKRNMTHIQEAQKDYIKKYDYVKKLVWSEDRTELIEKMLGLRKYVLFMIPIILGLTPEMCFLMVFWLALIKNSAYGKPLFDELEGKFNKFNDQLNQQIDYFANKYRLFPVPPENQPYYRKHSDNNLVSQKTFVIYENQRWWIGKGWTDLVGIF
jgi:hypothetical protein